MRFLTRWPGLKLPVRRFGRFLSLVLCIVLILAEILPAAARPAVPGRLGAEMFPSQAADGTSAAAPESYCTPPLCLAWSALQIGESTSLAWGDVDGDGDLDLAIGNNNQANRLYRNEQGALTDQEMWVSDENDPTTSLAWGDMDGDGDLDLAVGNSGAPNRVYRNEAGALTVEAVWSASVSDSTLSLAWGDLNGDGLLDLAVANDGYAQPSRIYLNENGMLHTDADTTFGQDIPARGVAWGDYDDDGDQDLVTTGSPNQLYRNDEGVLTLSTDWFDGETFTNPRGVAMVDYVGDGDLDITVSGWTQPNRIYKNYDGVYSVFSDWTSADSAPTASVAWGDYDGDGDLDLAAGKEWGIDIYRNDHGFITTLPAWSVDGSVTTSVAWGDVDGDGDLDLAAATAEVERDARCSGDAPRSRSRSGRASGRVAPATRPCGATRHRTDRSRRACPRTPPRTPSPSA